MTFDEFRERFERDRARIICHDTKQRNEALRFLDRHGYPLSECAKGHIKPKDDWRVSSVYLYPGFSYDGLNDIVACYASAPYGGRIEFEEFVELIKEENEDEERVNEEEIKEALFEMLYRM